MVAPPPEDFENEEMAPPEDLRYGERPPQDIDDQTLKMAAPLITTDRGKLDRLRELRAELQDLQGLLNNVGKGQVTLLDYAAYIQTTKGDIEALITEIDDGDTIRHIHNIWEQMVVCPLLVDPGAEFSAQQQLHYLEMLDEQINRIVLLVGAYTIPARVNDWLKQARPGYYIPFHLVFEDELPRKEDRVRVLNYLAWSPEAVERGSGIVDAANGLIYRYTADPKKRRWSFVWLILGFLLASAIAAGACLIPVAGWPLTQEDLGIVLVSWGAVLVGTLVHVGIGSVKRSQSGSGLPPVVALGDLSRTVDAFLGQILLKLFLALIGLFGLIFAAGIENLSPLNAFLVGYSLDSFLGLFGTTIEQQAEAQVTALGQQLGVEKTP